MIRGLVDWDPFSPAAWAQLLGLVHVPLFGEQGRSAPGEHAVLLDGYRGSFTISSSDEPRTRKESGSWSWSANVRHAVVLDRRAEHMIVHRWDEPHTRREREYTVPKQQGAEALLQQFERSRAPKMPNVVQWVMRVFRQLRQAIDDPVEALTVLNGLLLVSREEAIGHLQKEDVLRTKTVGEALSLLPQGLKEVAGTDALGTCVGATATGLLLPFLLDTEKQLGLELRADLLFRHAANELYQEAHLEIERDPQGYFPGLAPEPRLGRGPREVRYTPPNLARALVQKGFQYVSDQAPRASRFVVLDPACGSGVFLLECLRECQKRDRLDELALIGFDTSEIAVRVAESCLQLAQADSPGTVTAKPDVKRRDALKEPWPSSDLILMNPPFCSWQDMDQSERAAVNDVLADLAMGRTDKALAFVWKAVMSLRPGGVLAAVLPSALLDSRSSARVREALHDKADLLMVAKFEGFSYFSTSVVGTSFVVLRRRANSTTREHQRVEVLVSAEQWEDAALRALRGADFPQGEPSPVEIFEAPSETFGGRSWLPRRQKELELLQRLDKQTFPKITDLFEIRQGARTGLKQAFVLSAAELKNLPARERRFFRPAAGQGTLHQGALICSAYVFFPYDSGGVLIRSEEDLQRKVPDYYGRWLLPNRDRLERRVETEAWWLLARPREWQFRLTPKLVSTYFGGTGTFAYDASGDYVVVAGYAWNWKKDMSAESESKEARLRFDDTRLPYAYLALLNTPLFERVVSCFSWRLRGGQLRLERRFLRHVPIPDLSNQGDTSGALVARLAACGMKIAQGAIFDALDEAERAAFEAYQLPSDLA